MRELEHEMGVLVRRIRRVIAERARMLHPELSAVSYSMLRALEDSGPCRASELVEVFSIDKGAVSRHIQFLLELGFVERTPDAEDRRASIIAITAEGSRRLAEVAELRRRQVGESLSDWSEEELHEFVRALGRYNRALE